MKKIMALLGIACVMLVIPASNAVNFEITLNDATGDVSNPDIDITKLWTTVEGDKLVFHIKVAGEINDAYIYQVTASNGATEIGAIYSNGFAYFSGTTSAGQPEVSIDGDTLTMKMPYGLVSSWNAFSITGLAHDGAGTMDWATSGGGSSGGDNGGNEDGKTDPGDETPTDKSIDVKITKVQYSIEKVDNGQRWHTYILIEGTTSGVDHVSLSFVTYYKNGSYDASEWLKGPMEMEPGTFMENEITKFSFNSTEGNWNKWKLEMDIKYPITEPNYRWVEDSKEVDKFVIYARAFKDAQETKWNQAKYETKPYFTSSGATYESSGESNEGSSESGGGTPGFGILVAVAGIALAVVAIRRKG